MNIQFRRNSRIGKINASFYKLKYPYYLHISLNVNENICSFNYALVTFCQKNNKTAISNYHGVESFS